MSCKDCLPLGPLDPRTTAALVRVMGTPQYRMLATGVDTPPPTHEDGSVDTPKLVAREMARLRQLVSSGDFIQAVLAVLSLSTATWHHAQAAGKDSAKSSQAWLDSSRTVVADCAYCA